VHSDTWKVAFTQQFVQFSCSKCALDEDDDLVEFETIEQVVEFAILLALAEFDGILLKTVECELGLIIDKNFKRMSHELSANWPDCLWESGAEHHDLLLSRSCAEDLLDISAHVWASSR
jgi:hypothetical protein